MTPALHLAYAQQPPREPTHRTGGRGRGGGPESEPIRLRLVASDGEAIPK